MLKSYLKKVYETANRGDAREESYYSILEALLNEYKESTGRKNNHITTLPKKTEAGNPDFRIWDGKQHITGYIEAKAPTILDLDEIEESEQLKRYLHTFPNLILTNFFEFRLYRSGFLIDKVSIARPFVVHKLKTVPPVEKESDFLKLLEKFFSFSLPRVYDAKALAIELANRTRFLRDEVVTQELEEEENTKKGIVTGFYEAFRQFLISGLTKKDFADLYSQTITYGLFASRTRSENGFNRKLAYDNIPRTIGILRDVFKFISLEDPPPQMEWIIDDISEVLAVTDVKNILHQYFHEGKGKDPIVHFYETFLAVYDKETREKRGVYYTPEAVVSYIVRSLDTILKEHFNRADGFASDTVTVLDPAAGTLTFLAEASKLALEEFVSKYGEGGKENFIKEHILKDFYAFELMMAPYAVGHLKMSFLLEELGYKLQKDDRFKLYLTNTLEMEELAQTELPGMASLSEESHLAGKVKKETPILVILGNPPYSVSSANKSDFIEKEMELYKEDVRDEKNIQLLSDDYTKFIRFCHWKLEQTDNGTIGLITKNTYLSVSAFKGMRKKLLEFFDKIYVLNLHGKLYEKTDDGSPDENVFDIRVGTAILFLIKNGTRKTKWARLYYSDCVGMREEKYAYLSENSIKTTSWEEIEIHPEYFFFERKQFKHKEAYLAFVKINVIFGSGDPRKDQGKLWASGIKTNRDSLLTDDSERKLFMRMSTLQNINKTDDEIRLIYGLQDGRYWQTSRERKKVKHINLREHIHPYAYKPFTTRLIYYQPNLIEIGRGGASKHIMPSFLSDNVGLVIKKSFKEKEYHHCFVTSEMTDINFLSGQSYVFPLYLYSDIVKKDLFSHENKSEKRQANINPKLFTPLSEVYKKEPTPEDIFYYIYAILYSNIYRTKYAEFLKIDFPRIPFTKDYKLFSKLAEYGKKLVDLHLMKSVGIYDNTSQLKSIAKFQGKGDNLVERVQYNEEEKRVYINPKQYFENIEKEVWQYQIGGYQVCNKWMKDRKERKLSLDDIKHYCNIATSLQETIKVQKEIDNIYPEVEKKTLNFENG